MFYPKTVVKCGTGVLNAPGFALGYTSVLITTVKPFSTGRTEQYNTCTLPLVVHMESVSEE